jgi:hypothetical protein
MSYVYVWVQPTYGDATHRSFTYVWTVSEISVPWFRVRVHRGTNRACAGTRCLHAEVSQVGVHACINMVPFETVRPCYWRYFFPPAVFDWHSGLHLTTCNAYTSFMKQVNIFSKVVRNSLCPPQACLWKPTQLLSLWLSCFVSKSYFRMTKETRFY